MTFVSIVAMPTIPISDEIARIPNQPIRHAETHNQSECHGVTSSVYRQQYMGTIVSEPPPKCPLVALRKGGGG